MKEQNEKQAIEEMAKVICHAPNCEIKKNGGSCYKYCKAYIYAFRAINAGYRKQRVGEWLSVEGDVIFKCSLCDTEISTSWDYEEENMFRYCPCCGAHMKGGAG